MLKPVNNDRGSASVLVILIMISLITFGLLAMLLANSDYKMAKKNAKWLEQQYAVESQAALAEADLDGMLSAIAIQAGPTARPDVLFSEVGKAVERLNKYGQNWRWQAETNVVACELAENPDGQSMYLEFKIIVSPQSGVKQLDYDVVSWRAVKN